MAARAALLGVVLLMGCAGFGSSGADLARTWDGGRVYVPDSGQWFFSDVLPAAMTPARPIPTVLYMHSCVGIGANDDVWARTLSEAGFVVIVPNSYARPGRVSGCRRANEEILNLRAEEIEYAQERLRKLAWVDQRNVFLMGHSEGAGAVALWRGSGFRGHVISPWSCTHRLNAFLDGIHAPSSTPVLAVNFETDPDFSGAMVGRCGSKLGNRRGSRELILRGSSHYPMYSAEGRQAVIEFLRTQTKP